jgi:hypothetical protein
MTLGEILAVHLFVQTQDTGNRRRIDAGSFELPDQVFRDWRQGVA